MQGSIIINESLAQWDDLARHQELSEAFTRLGYQFCKRHKSAKKAATGYVSAVNKYHQSSRV
ncbi:MAG: hypothetical protein MJK10_06965 [Pseudomonadales bacterium]|nr:hypothetical protein [Pseudomonadales bacterium]NRA13959.1 hypothetical protein [Oceanospirillaceae bacterium]